MQSRGLLEDDLPADARGLDRQIYTAIRRGEYDRAVDMCELLGRAVAAVRVDRAFLDGKLQRVGNLRSRRPMDPTSSAQIDSLLAEVTALAADGDYGSANGRINRIAALLH